LVVSYHDYRARDSVHLRSMCKSEIVGDFLPRTHAYWINAHSLCILASDVKYPYGFPHLYFSVSSVIAFRLRCVTTGLIGDIPTPRYFCIPKSHPQDRRWAPLYRLPLTRYFAASSDFIVPLWLPRLSHHAQSSPRTATRGPALLRRRSRSNFL